MKTAHALLIVLICSVYTPASAQFNFDLEGGLILGTSYNKVQIPSGSGTRVNLPEQLDLDRSAFYRIRAGYRIGNRHNISALFAPLTIHYRGSLDQTTNFNNNTYLPGQPLNVDYRFNSYRLTYRYDFFANGKWRVGAGLTAKVRDADIRFKSEYADTHYDNLGFVPLINFYASWKPAYHWTVILEGDALAAKQGRAEDIFGGIAYNFNNTIGIKLGYRMLEGGADNDKIYNFNWINYASAGILISL
ncbi:Outer membrane protein beta-barrel domain-containing protein [Dyadobacter soli]|uniref:Outer membrane protein beta-barrel domain-containing protein n=1 Tax=Dyadobacter soli TaxID=659014 RepID=A0A1G8D2D7_9BACT|nr:outer membrane beta-barrel protein [Dyadobacter soli]SDH51693.1 Outer membrane protein beta-barrel domain-containing protein [Dyadobacter soli]